MSDYFLEQHADHDLRLGPLTDWRIRDMVCLTCRAFGYIPQGMGSHIALWTDTDYENNKHWLEAPNE